VVDESTTSAGQAPLVPVQYSLGSHVVPLPFGSPDPGRHNVLAARGVQSVVLTSGWQDWQLFG